MLIRATLEAAALPAAPPRNRTPSSARAAPACAHHPHSGTDAARRHLVTGHWVASQTSGIAPAVLTPMDLVRVLVHI